MPSKPKTTDFFVNQAIARWKDLYDYANTIYINSITKIVFYCKKCKKHVEQYPGLHLKTGCQFCNGRGISRYTVESFIEAAVKIHGTSTFDYSKIKELKSIHDKVPITCRNCNLTFNQRACNHINGTNKKGEKKGNGCPNCKGGVKYTNEQYIAKVKEVHPRIDCSNINYTKSHDQVTLICPKHGEYKQLAYMVLQSQHSCPGCVSELTSSKAEQEIYDFLANYKETVFRNQKILDKYEIDLYVPELKLGIEFHGNFFHTQTIVGQSRHKKKADLAEDKGILLFQIYETEWNSKKEILLSKIKSALGANERIFARKTKIVELDASAKNLFLEQNHIQGKDTSTVYFGLECGDKLVACITFGKSRYNKNYDWELIRYCCVRNVNVVGGLSKLLSHFRKFHKGSIISYADRRYSNGNLYKKTGFILDGVTEPGYVYYNIKTKEVFSRVKFQKHKLKNMPGYSPELSEYDIMKLNGYDRIWDAGQYRFVLRENNDT